MNKHVARLGAVVGLLVTLVLAPQAQALLITDPGVVGTIEAGTQSANVDNELDWANYLLSIVGTDVMVTLDGNIPLDGDTENYHTGATDYSGILTGGNQMQATGGAPDMSSYEWAFGKYDGENAGYVLFNMGDWFASSGSYMLPMSSADIWTHTTGEGEEGYGLSHVTGFGRSKIPDGGATIPLLGLALLGAAALRNRLR